MANRVRNRQERPGQPGPTRRESPKRRRPTMSGGVAATSPEARRRDMGSGSATGNPRNQGAPRTIANHGYGPEGRVVAQQGTGHYGRGQREQVGQRPQEPIAVLPNPVDRGNMLTDIMGAIGLGGIVNNVQGVMPQAYWENPFFYPENPSNQVPAGWWRQVDGEPMFVDGQQVFGYGDAVQFDAAGGGTFGQYRYEDDPRTSIANYNASGLEEYVKNLHGYGRGPLNTGFGYYSTGR